MRFKNREEAARQLAARLSKYKGAHPLVLGIPRGAVPMAAIIADELGGDLDVVLVRKLTAPYDPELAIGAIDESGALLRGEHFAMAGVTDEYLQRELVAQQDVLRRRRACYTRIRGPLDPSGRIVIIVDDGVATGSSMLAAVRSVRAQGPARLIVAIGVAAQESLDRIRVEADEVVCLRTPLMFYAVGDFYKDFSEVTDATVVAALMAHAPAAAV